jgi:hypothetical protein
MMKKSKYAKAYKKKVVYFNFSYNLFYKCNDLDFPLFLVYQISHFLCKIPIMNVTNIYLNNNL